MPPDRQFGRVAAVLELVPRGNALKASVQLIESNAIEMIEIFDLDLKIPSRLDCDALELPGDAQARRLAPKRRPQLIVAGSMPNRPSRSPPCHSFVITQACRKDTNV